MSEQPPSGLPSGGVWGTNTYHGDQTNLAGCVGCLCFGVPGLLICCFCPCDERDAYKVNGVVYDAEGKKIGNAGEAKFVPKATRMER